MAVVLKALGKTPVRAEVLMICSMSVETQLKMFFMRKVEIGSRLRIDCLLSLTML